MPHIRVKICGVTTPADAVFAAENGADSVGLNFYSKSPRYITGQLAESIVRELAPFSIAVGVFVGTPDALIGEAVQQLGLRGVQTYTAEPPDLDFFPAAHIPAFRVKDEADLAAIRRFIGALRELGRPPAAVLVDAHVPGSFGGTGHRAPWDLLAGFAPGVPLILAGGLTPENVAGAIRAVRPWGVDVASGVESAPGRKDPGKVRAFLEAAKGVAT
jgi:phosphoribosylanthranilate isomerase